MTDKITCMECGKSFKRLSNSHLKSHGFTREEYQEKYHSAQTSVSRSTLRNNVISSINEETYGENPSFETLREITRVYFVGIHKKNFKRQLDKNTYLKNLIETRYPDVDTFSAIQLIDQNEPGIPKCHNPQCSNLTYSEKSKRVTKFCSKECSSNYHAKDNLHKREQTNLERYGVRNHMMDTEFSNKALETKKLHYGKGNSPLAIQKAVARCPELNRKGRITIQEKFGVNNPSQIPGHSDKVKATCRERYGNDSWNTSDEYQKIVRDRTFAKYEQIVPGDLKEIIYPTEEELIDVPYKLAKIKFTCKSCGAEESIPSETFKWRTKKFGTPCKSCTGIKPSVSAAETQVADFIRNLGIDIQTSDRTIIGPKELDIVIPSHKVAIEFDGLFWHSESRGKDKNYHLSKTLEAKKNGYRLIHIIEDEWVHRRPIVEQKIKSILGLNRNSIYARKTSVETIPGKEAKKFLEENHIQGHVASTIHLGLKSNGHLVALMSFSHGNQAKGSKSINDTWELTRYATSIHVVGGAGKLLSHFIKTYKPEEIFSYSDNRWSVGNLYEKLGFKKANDGKPNYWYIEGDKRKHRYNFRKDVLVKEGFYPDKTEHEIMIELGYDRIWDCGHTKWVWITSA